MSSSPVEVDGLQQLSPSELKDLLIQNARDFSRSKAATHNFLDAGRGNPNWVATTPREAFFVLGRFALSESKRVWDEAGFGGMPHADGIADRLHKYLFRAGDAAGVELLRRALDYAVGPLGFDADSFVHELADSIIGDTYPVPDRMLVHAEQIVHRYLAKVMCDDHPPPGRFDLFAVEGGTAAMCYVFKSLLANRLLRPGDTVALGAPIVTPYVELPHLDDFGLQTIQIAQTGPRAGFHTWQYPEAEIEKLADPKVRAFFLVNPSNPASFAMTAETQAQIVELVRNRRPDLIILTDDVYGTFVEGFRSLAADLPANTILVYSYSKHFGCTGWRLGVVGLHADNILDGRIAALPDADREVLRRRYGSLTPDPDSIKFIDRMVADSRDVALNHTAGLSPPQQVQMALFSLFALLDYGDLYERRCRAIIHERLARLAQGLRITAPTDPLRVGTYVDIDLEVWGRKEFGEDFVRYAKAHRQPVEVVLALARRHGTVLLNHSGFDGPPWTVRISLANLDADDYEAIGRDLRETMQRALEEWKRLTGQTPAQE
jgi:aspartate 4-decarboxylase